MTEITEPVDTERRFSGLARLYGDDAPEIFRRAHVAVAGLGGVGSWCAEALARCGVGALTLIDMDHIAESNVNRQLHALTATLGQSKVQAMTDRVVGINPACRVVVVDDFVDPDNVTVIFPADVDVIIDCTDQMSAKLAMILEARRRQVPVVVCGGAGGKTAVTALHASDLSVTQNDALLSKLRNTLRRQHGYPRAAAAAGKAPRRIPKMGVRAVWFDQPAVLPDLWAKTTAAPAVMPTADSAAGVPVAGAGVSPGVTDGVAAAPQGLSCAGYGSAVMVTAAMGMAAAGEAIQWLLTRRFA
ncbi:MAG: tRNA threonylcarbamoyladenosine dehydratase [Alcaligenaceae bacterium]|nr:tRNA threonylcarbamoyladenosine dehydratase [Alcaligenaceae bacterium]